MPRLSPNLLHRLRKQDPLLPLLLQATRDPASAKNELRWLREFVDEQRQKINSSSIGLQTSNYKDMKWQRRLRKLCKDRARGKPLQYILGTEYFGDLEIACAKDVLIPRQETAASVMHLVRRLSGNDKLPEHLRVLDLCTGTGCIPLLVGYELAQTYGKKKAFEAVGVDISSHAMALAEKNLKQLSDDGSLRLEPPIQSIRFVQADILADTSNGEGKFPTLLDALQSYEHSLETRHSGRWDILISNPPYISPKAFNQTTTRSVKRYEPKLALVPRKSSSSNLYGIDPGDIFYPRLLDIAKDVDAQVVLFEVADLEQAIRVALMMQRQGIWTAIEIWQDDPVHADEGDVEPDASIPSGVNVVGSGNGRSVFAYRGHANTWLEGSTP